MAIEVSGMSGIFKRIPMGETRRTAKRPAAARKPYHRRRDDPVEEGSPRSTQCSPPSCFKQCLKVVERVIEDRTTGRNFLKNVTHHDTRRRDEPDKRSIARNESSGSRRQKVHRVDAQGQQPGQ